MLFKKYGYVFKNSLRQYANTIYFIKNIRYVKFIKYLENNKLSLIVIVKCIETYKN
jgi:hypothetical protein